MGLTRDGQELNTTDNHFVAVEFDIYQNSRWDPPGLHVGIDIKSMRSIANVSWLISNTSIMEGRKNEAWISYNSSSHNLNVVFTGLRNNVPVRQFLSEIVDLRLHLPEFVAFGFSAATGNASAMHTIYSWDFSSSLETDDGIVTNPTWSSAPSRSKNKKLGLGLRLGAGGFVSVGGLALVLLALWKKSRRDQEDDLAFAIYMDEEFQKGTEPKRFSFKELVRATKNFSDEEKLGEGGFGGVYRGFLRDSNASVAIKRVSKASKQGIKEYASKIKIIGQLRHRNLVQLLGWCHEKRELLLVYEFLSNGSLDSFLFKDTSLLIWELRYKIAQGLASALLYLHEEWEQCVVHRDIKSSNIMLDSDFNAKLGDFGLARFVDHAKGSRTTVLAGTMGYMAPECVTSGQVGKESDVYSFGIVALEIARGRKPVTPRAPEDQVIMLEWVWGLYGRGEVVEAADPRLLGDFNEKQMERLMIVGLWCARKSLNAGTGGRIAHQTVDVD
ncbi:L-type lectin-domain containing receptor kinase IX.1-like [Carya illinoinensis]|uniref:L-type lectin-domain containing receptor kinase IX.1-like n=1 Tax=Carya illinoinensis TaxID=32201 RepID=UPI001C71BC8D|nr:L-type lectin-domain containing receptor kinase IX.1-like [Carya illinoinensis]